MENLIGYLVYHSPKKVYIDYMHYGCIARLCKVSAEYYKVKDDEESIELIESVLNTNFIEFKRKCYKYYDIIIDDRHCPKWSK
jgi:hypothetical protein